MIVSDKLRRRAWLERERLGFALDALVTADLILAALQESTGIYICPVAGDDPLLGDAQAVLNLDQSCIFQSDDLSAEDKRYDAAHEYGHWFLHSQTCSCNSEDFSVDLDELEALPVAKLDGYSPRERRESEANTFAAEILLPLQLARRCFEDLNFSSTRIASELGISDAIARRQLTDAVLLPIPAYDAPVAVAPPAAELDPSQKRAAEAADGPLLLSAGPGTGKTKTLVGRCIYLSKERRHSPESILALTFSRKATSEMFERLHSAGVGSVGAGPWVGTFHAFGMELLRKYGDRIGLAPGFQLIGPMDCVALLENNLNRLGLSHLRNIRNPAHHLSGILRQIGRAKDELCSPENFSVLAAEMINSAGTALEQYYATPGKRLKKDERPLLDSVTRAARVEEVARIYAICQNLLASANLVDFGDLIYRSVDLLMHHPDVRRALHRQYPNVLADEYQDVNRASARLLKLLVGESAEGLWVVGDHRQSIFQFQGASPANVSLFQKEYPTGRIEQLAVNYRSVEDIVETFSAASRNMSFSKKSPGASQWVSFRGKSSGNAPAATLMVLDDVGSQYRFISDRIEALRATGISYSQQCVLLRTHSQAREAADLLGRSGVPTLYLGPILDRPEIKDLVAVLTLCTEYQSAAFVRVAAMPEYAFTESEALSLSVRLSAVWDSLKNDDAAALSALDISEEATLALTKLSEHLAQLREYMERPGALIRKYIFDTSSFLQSLETTGRGEFEAVLSRLAVRTFIEIIEGFQHRAVEPGAEESLSRCGKLLTHLRRLAAVGGSSTTPDLELIGDIDAVRVSTVHSVKGLEFPAVYLPNLNEGQFPGRGRHDGIPEPAGLSSSEAEEADEEECLFFVALSRARDYLVLSRYLKKPNGEATKPSPLLSTLTDALNSGLLPTEILTEEIVDQEPDERMEGNGLETGPLPVFTSSELEVYERCPRLYYYDKTMGLSGAQSSESYRKLHRAVGELVDWIEELTASGQTPSLDARRDKLSVIWLEKGPVGDLHEQTYFHEALKIAEVEPAQIDGESKRLTLTAKLKNALVQVRPDRVSIKDGELHLSRRVIGERGDSDHNHKRLALFRRAAADSYPDLTPSVELHYLNEGAVVDVPESPRYEPNRLAKYEAAVEGIQAKRFPPKPASNDTCTTCQFYFTCPRTADEEDAV